MEARAIAIEAAHQAGELIRQHFSQPHEIQAKGPADYVTEVDLKAEDMMVRIVQQAFPRHSFLAEEKHQPDQDAKSVWVIDPLDGTRNYIRGIPFFCTSIALVEKERAILGVIYDPLRNETFVAQAGEGLCLNGTPIRLSKQTLLKDAIVYFGFRPSQHPGARHLSLPLLTRLRPRIEAVRKMGSAALSLTYVACGRLDVACHDHLAPWDMMAATVMIKEAGGVATDFEGKNITLASESIIAAGSPSLHANVLDVARVVLNEHRSPAD